MNKYINWRNEFLLRYNPIAEMVHRIYKNKRPIIVDLECFWWEISEAVNQNFNLRAPFYIGFYDIVEDQYYKLYFYDLTVKNDLLEKQKVIFEKLYLKLLELECDALVFAGGGLETKWLKKLWGKEKLGEFKQFDLYHYIERARHPRNYYQIRKIISDKTVSELTGKTVRELSSVDLTTSQLSKVVRQEHLKQISQYNHEELTSIATFLSQLQKKIKNRKIKVILDEKDEIASGGIGTPTLNFKNNGHSNQKVELKQGVVVKEKNNNYNLMCEILNLIDRDIITVPEIQSINERQFSYPMIIGSTFDNTYVMRDRYINQAIKIIEYLQSLPRKKGQVVVHGDLSPSNIVINDKDKIFAVIDWDSCHYGNKYEDVVMLVWLWVNIGYPYHKEIYFVKKIQNIVNKLNFTNDDTAKLQIELLQRIRSEKEKNNLAKPHLIAWYNYCEKWIEDNWVLVNEAKY
jgi:thiamine kinase-like enzyme